MHKCIGAVKRSGRTMNELNGIIIKFRDKGKLFSKCATKLDYCPTVTGTGESNFVLYDNQEKRYHEDKNEVDCFFKNLVSNLSIHNPVLLFVWRTVIRTPLIPTDLMSYTAVSTMDSICRCSLY